MQLRSLSIAVLSLCCASTALADQYAYVTVQEAAAAMKAIGEGHVVQTFCAPCGDTRSRQVKATTLAIGRVWEGSTAAPSRTSEGESFWELTINDEPADLAYVYVRRDSQWKNLAMVLGLKVVDVPQYLDAARVGPSKP